MERSEPASIQILVVDDDPTFRAVLTARLSRKGYGVSEAENGEKALKRLRKKAMDLALVDLVMPGLGGIELLERMKGEQPELEVIVLTGHATVDTAIEAMKLGAHDYLTKPCKLSELEVVLQKAREKQRLAQQNLLLKEVIQRGQERGEIAGRSRAIEQVKEMIAQVAAFPSPVLIEGESGTGKELVARTLHRQSPRTRGPFVAVNCASLHEELLESELFGHERGAFTGAVQKKRGLFEVADGGTLLIDEIGELSAGVQAKLLRVLERKEFRALGSVREKSADVRVVAATHRDMRREVEAGRFRQDLYYRINVVSIHVPPLRERLEDIPLLARHFLARAEFLRGRRKRLSPEALARLKNYEWPGNVRELFNALERALIVCRGEEIGPGDLPETIGAFPVPALEQSAATTLAAVEHQHLLKVLAREGGNRTRAAAALGIHRRQLYRLMHKYEIEEA